MKPAGESAGRSLVGKFLSSVSAPCSLQGYGEILQGLHFLLLWRVIEIFSNVSAPSLIAR